MCTRNECRTAVGVSLNHIVQIAGDSRHRIRPGTGRDILVSCSGGEGFGIVLHVVEQSGKIRGSYAK